MWCQHGFFTASFIHCSIGAALFRNSVLLKAKNFFCGQQIGVSRVCVVMLAHTLLMLCA